jgi:uncharacterized protein
MPYALIDPDRDPKLSDVNRTIDLFASTTGLLVVRDTEEIHNSLCVNLHKHNIAALTLELGEPNIINEKNVEYGVRSIQKILLYLEMIKPVNEPFQYQIPDMYKGKILKYFAKPQSTTSGIIRFLVKPGDIVKKDQTLCKIYNTFGRLQKTLTALHDGIVLGHCDSCVAFPGMPVLAFGIE